LAQYRVFDEETARLLSIRVSGADSIDFRNSGEFFSADAGEVILAPSVKTGDVLYIRIKNSNQAAADVPATPVAERKPKPYVATGFLGLEGEVEEDVLEQPKPWWKKLFID
jgi:hypothetical protein